jgi:hypothetical protein
VFAADEIVSSRSRPFLYIILIRTSGEIGSSEVALMKLANLIFLERTHHGVSNTSVMEQHQIFLSP